MTPPPGLRAKVLERIRSQPPASEFLTLRQQHGWKSLAPGIEVKLLFLDKAAGLKSFLLRAAPGISMPEHHHEADEECLVLEGEFTIDGVTLRAGDYQLAAKGTRHGVSSTATGVVVYLRASIADYPGV